MAKDLLEENQIFYFLQIFNNPVRTWETLARGANKNHLFKTHGLNK